MAGYYALLHVLIGALGNGEPVVRLPSAIASATTTMLVGLLAIRLFDQRVAFASGLLTAVSLPLVFWGQDARGYASLVALVTGSFLAFMALVDGEPHRRGGRSAWVAYAALTTLALYMSFVAVLVVPAQLVTLLRRRRAWRAVGSALAASAACCAPLVVLAARRGSGQLFWVPRPSITAGKQVLEALSSSALAPSFPTTSTTAVLAGLTVVLVVGAAVSVGRGLRRSGRRGDPRARSRRRADPRTMWGQMLVLSWLAVPVALAWLESLLGQPIFLPRNLLISLPAVALVLGWSVAHGRVPRRAAWSLLAALIVLRAIQLVPSYGVSPEDWRAASGYVLARAQQRDCIAFYPSDGRMAFQYYIGDATSIGARRAPTSVLPPVPWGEVVPYVERYVIPSRLELARLPADCPRLWLVSSHRGQPDGPARSRANRARYLVLRSELRGDYAGGRTVAFGYASPVRVELLTR